MIPDDVRMRLQFFENWDLAHCCWWHTFIIILKLNFFKSNCFIVISIFSLKNNTIGSLAYPFQSFIFFFFVHINVWFWIKYYKNEWVCLIIIHKFNGQLIKFHILDDQFCISILFIYNYLRFLLNRKRKDKNIIIIFNG